MSHDVDVPAPSRAIPASRRAGRAGTLLRRLGFPVVEGRRRTVVAVAIDAVGSGVFMPMSLLYFLATTDLPLLRVGAALTLAAAVALPIGPLLGGVVDRWGARSVLLVGNVLQAVSFGAYLLADSFAAVTFWAAVNAVGRTAFWGAFAVAVAAFTPQDAREQWFGFFGALRNVGFAAGGLVAGVAITVGTELVLKGVVLLIVACFGTASVLLARAPELPARTARPVSTGSWRQVWADRPYQLLVLLQFLYSVAMTVTVFAVPVYVTSVLGLPGWVVGVAFTTNTLMVGLCQGLAVRGLAGVPRWRALALAHVTFLAGYLLLLLPVADPPPVAAVALVLVGTVVFTVGELVGSPVQTALSVEAAPAALLGRYTSLTQLAHHGALTFAPLAFAGLLTSHGGASLWSVLIVLAGVSAALSVLLAAAMPAARQRISRTPAGS